MYYIFRVYICIALICGAVLLSGCDFFKFENDGYWETNDVTPDMEAKEQTRLIIKAINNKGKLWFMNNLSNKLVASDSSIETEIENLLDYIDGEIVEYSDIGPGISAYTKVDGEYTEMILGGLITGVKDENGNEYRMDFQYYYISEDDDNIGICYIRIWKPGEPDDDIVIGKEQIT